MLYHLLYPLAGKFFVFNVFRYVTFRSVYASVTAFLICLLLGKYVINKIRDAQLGEKIRTDGPASHSAKAGTPTMGGILILLALVTSILLWVRWDSKFIWIIFFATLGFGSLGLVDDYLKLMVKNKSRGIPAVYKFMLQTLIAIIIVFCYLAVLPDEFHLKTSITLPFFKYPLNLDQLYPYFAVIVIVGASNAVNLTDGLDGLAIGCTTFAALAFVIIAYVSGNVKFSEYLKIIMVPGAREMTVVCAALVGAGLGFLWFNAHPAQVFMGDTGSLALGGLLGTIAVDRQAGNAPDHRGRHLRGGGPVGHPPGDLLQDEGKAHLQDGALAPPFRTFRACLNQNSSSGSGSSPSS